MASNSGILLPEISVSTNNLWLVLIENRPGEEVQTLVGDSLVEEGKSND